ncbi:MAG: PEGA domain-containing protein [Polyangiaceae bacterium]
MPASNVDASPEALEAAKLFHQGSAAYDAGRFEEALRSWRAAWDLHRTFDIAGNLAQVELKLGKRRGAAEHLTYALRNFPPSAKATVRAEMEARLDALKKDIPSVRVRVNVPEAEVLVDGQVVGRAPLSDALYVEPGKHLIAARHAGHTEAQQEVELAPGNTQDVELTLAAAPLEQPATPADGGAPRLNTGLLVGGIALAAAGLATGIVGTVVSSGAASDEADLQGPLDAQGISSCLMPANQLACTDRDDARDRKRTFRGVGIAGFVVGGAAAIATVVYVATRPTSRVVTEGRQVTPNAWLGPRGGALGVSGRF